MAVQCPLPDKLYREHTVDNTVLVYSRYRTTFLITWDATFEEMVFQAILTTDYTSRKIVIPFLACLLYYHKKKL